MFDQQKTFSLIFNRDHCQRFSLSQISDTPWAEFEPAQNLSSGLLKQSCAVVINTLMREWLINRSGVFQAVREVISFYKLQTHLLPTEKEFKTVKAQIIWKVFEIKTHAKILMLMVWTWNKLEYHGNMKYELENYVTWMKPENIICESVKVNTYLGTCKVNKFTL